MVIDEKTEYITPEMSFDRTVDKILNGNKNTRKDKSYEVILTNKKHQETLRKYYLYCKQAGNSPKTIMAKLKILKYFFIFVKKDVSKIKREDIEKFFEFYSTKKCCRKVDGKKEYVKISTLNLVKITVKFFFKWYYRTEEGYPKIVKWIVPTKIKQKDKEILTHEEIKKLITSATMTRDRCLISILYDGGLRIGEAVNIKMKDITEDSYGFKIKVNGKTGERRIRLTNSVPILRKWINEHPNKEDTNSFLFVCLAKQFGMPLGTHGGYKIVEQSAKRANIQKRIHPHLFRHSRLTHLAEDGFNEMDLRIFAGWSSTSDMPSVYLHNSEKNVEDKILRKEGLINKSEDKRIEENKKKLRPRECPMCETLNDVGNRFCSKCGQILDVKAIKDIEKTKELVVFTEEKKREMVEELRKELLNELLNKVK